VDSPKKAEETFEVPSFVRGLESTETTGLDWLTGLSVW